MRFVWAHQIMGLMLTLLVSACGGGGGGGGESANTGASQTDRTGTGLLPSEPQPGAVLYADAATLRPLGAQYRWIYSGVDRVQGMETQARRYTNVVTQMAAGAGFMEKADNPFGLGSSSLDGVEPLMLETGVLRQRIRATLLEGLRTDPLDFVELRSPVRQGEQYSIYDRRMADIGRDLDGDKRNDGLDLAIWVRVEGEELVDLPQRAQVKTIKTVLTFQLRPVYSSGKAAVVSELKQTTWYLANVGIVKRQIDMPHESLEGMRRIATEELSAWDGGTRGMGAMAPQALVAPAGSDRAGQLMSSELKEVAGFDQHVVLMSEVQGRYPAYGVTLTHLDARGLVVAERSYRFEDLFGTPSDVGGPRLLRVGAELRLLVSTGSGVLMRRLNATGQQLLDAAPVRLLAATYLQNEVSPSSDFRHRPFTAEASADGIWLSWLSRLYKPETGEYLESLHIQGFDVAGQARTPVRTLAANRQSLSGSSMAIRDTRLLVSWAKLGINASWSYAVLDTRDGRQLASFAIPGVEPDTFQHPQSLALEGGLGLALQTQAGRIAFAWLDPASFELRLPPGQVLASQTLDIARSGVAGYGSQFYLAAASLMHGGMYEVPGSFGRYEWLLAQLPSDGDGAQLSQAQLFARIPASISFTRWVPLGNRIIGIGRTFESGPGTLATVVIWR